MVGFKAAGKLILKALVSTRVVNYLGDLVVKHTKNQIDDGVWELKKALDSGSPAKIEEALMKLGYNIKVEIFDGDKDGKDAKKGK